MNEVKQSSFQFDSPDEAVKFLFEQLSPIVPETTRKEIDSQYDEIRSTWGSRTLVNGSAEEIKMCVLANLKSIFRMYEAKGATYATFQVNTDVANHTAAQFNVFFRRSLGFGTVPIRVWRCRDVYYACGNSDFREMPSSIT